MFGFLITIHVLVSLILISIVLLQSGRGAELGAAFGSVGQANNVRGVASFMSKFTTALAITFMITSLSLAYLSADGSKSSVVDKISSEPIQETNTTPESKN